MLERFVYNVAEGEVFRKGVNDVMMLLEDSSAIPYFYTSDFSGIRKGNFCTEFLFPKSEMDKNLVEQYRSNLNELYGRYLENINSSDWRLSEGVLRSRVKRKVSNISVSSVFEDYGKISDAFRGGFFLRVGVSNEAFDYWLKFSIEKGKRYSVVTQKGMSNFMGIMEKDLEFDNSDEFSFLVNYEFK